MLCAIYKSLKKEETYLYIQKKGDFSPVPEALLAQFGKPQLVMLFNLAGDKPLLRAEKEKVLEAINESGFYLQLPPPPENYLDQHKAWCKSQSENKETE